VINVAWGVFSSTKVQKTGLDEVFTGLSITCNSATSVWIFFFIRKTDQAFRGRYLHKAGRIPHT